MAVPVLTLDPTAWDDVMKVHMPSMPAAVQSHAALQDTANISAQAFTVRRLFEGSVRPARE